MTLAQATPRPTDKWLVAASVGFGAIMGTIDASIVNVAMPHIRSSVGATLQEITWISTAYIIATVMVMPLTGFMGAMFGQKRIYLASLAIFLVGSALCGLARSLPALVLFRFLQGLGAGSLQPTQQAILRQTFPPEEQGMAIALFGVVIMIGPAIGPTLGGWITDNYTWPWIFYINLPVGLLGLLMVSRFVHEPEDVRAANVARAAAQRGNVDWIGIATMCVGVAALQYFLEEGQSEDWFASGEIALAAAVAGVALAAFVVRELTAPVPAVDLRLFRDRTFLAGTLIGAMQFALLMGGMFLLPVFLQELVGLDATRSGLWLLPRSLVMIAAVPIVGRLYNHVPPAWTVAFGIVTFSIGCYQMSLLTAETSAWDLLWPNLVTGVGFACLFVPLTTAALSQIPRHKLADAAGLNSFIRQSSASAGIAITATLLTRFAVEARAGLLPAVTALRPEVAATVAGASTMLARAGLDPAAVTAYLEGRVTMQAMVLAFERSFLLQGLALLAVLPVLFFLRVPRGAAAGPKPQMAATE